MKVRKKSTLFEYLLETIGTATPSKIRRMIKSGQARVDGEFVFRPDTPLRKGQKIELIKKSKGPKVPQLQFSGKPIHIIFEDDQIIAAEKPEGMISSGPDTNRTKSFSNKLKAQLSARENKIVNIFPVKRLDKDLSGILLFAKSEKIKEKMRSLWANFEVRYCALVEGGIREEQGQFRNYLRQKKSGGTLVVTSGELKDLAITKWKLLKKFSNHSLVELRPETELKHQLRIQLSKMKNPVVGDYRYGAKENLLGRLALHMHFIKFEHPVTGEEIKLTTPFPKKFSSFAKGYRKPN